jgi:hypothetical protein
MIKNNVEINRVATEMARSVCVRWLIFPSRVRSTETVTLCYSFVNHQFAGKIALLKPQPTFDHGRLGMSIWTQR